MIPQIETQKGRRDPLVARAGRVLSLAIARANGKLALQQEVPAAVLGHWLGRTQVDRAKNLAWSVGTLRRELTLQKDPGLMTELGEALSVLEGGQDEARSILESLRRARFGRFARRATRCSPTCASSAGTKLDRSSP